MCNLLRAPLAVYAVLFLGGAQLFSQHRPLDDTAAFVHLAPNPVNAVACDGHHVDVVLTGTNVRVFDLRFVFDSANYILDSVTAGSHLNLHVMPHLVNGDTIWLDAFFHPNFTGSTTIATLHFAPLDLNVDQTTFVGFLDGQGFSGTGEAPEPMIILGDTTTVQIDGNAPLAPDSLVIIPFADDSVGLYWYPVRFDVDGDPVVNPSYLIEFEDTWNNTGIVYPVGSTNDTFYYDDYIYLTFNPGDSGTVNAGVYRVRANKCQP